jgi:hypothetical protein
MKILLARKISLPFYRISAIHNTPRATKRGDSRSSRFVGAGCGGRSTSSDLRCDADGQVVWSRSPDAGIKPVDLRFRPCGRNAEIGDGGYQARYSRESAKQPLKPLRRGCRIVSALPVYLVCILPFQHTRLAGAASARHSLRPLPS